MSSRCVAAVLVIALLGAGCGGEKTTEEDRVRDVLAQLQTAVAAGDYRRLCTRILSRALVTRVRSVGLPCERALAVGLGTVKRPTVKVTRVRLRGERLALAEVRTGAQGQAPATDTFRLVKENGTWRVDSLSGAQPPAPERQGP